MKRILAENKLVELHMNLACWVDVSNLPNEIPNELFNKEKLTKLKALFDAVKKKLYDTFVNSLPEEIQKMYKHIFIDKNGNNTCWKEFYCSKSTYYRNLKKLFLCLTWLWK
ncbi:hypothetical protein FJO69_01605 [[Mycoplasma] falconis]|uniref:Uncharacterized protein n=1 Tax=[Mycoplasma] falconis TaxID=92403 RepID=A0A501XAH5_9BACT|nr:hypothetical protein [[Mycoplasma] falconis]TPE57429.1 hypothetical protein FJO69_01605 [[Mycoplasma] falconis]